MAIFDLNNNELIRYGTRLIVSEDTIRGIRIDSIFLNNYALDSSLYILEYDGDMLSATQHRADGVSNTVNDIDPQDGTVTVGTGIISWTVTTDRRLANGRIIAHIARVTGNYLGDVIQDINEFGLKKITTDSSQNIATANCTWRRDGGSTWNTGNITGVIPGEVFDIRINSYPTAGRYFVSLLQGNHRYQQVVTVIDKNNKDNIEYEVKIGTGDSWETMNGVTGTFNENITLAGLDIEEPLYIWARGKNLETLAQSYQQLFDNTFTLEAGFVYPPPEIESIVTDDGELYVTLSHPYPDYKLFILKYRDTQRRVIYYIEPVTVYMGKIPYGYNHELTMYTRAGGYNSDIISTTISGYWESSLPPLESTQVGAGTSIQPHTPLEDEKSYLNGRVVVKSYNTSGSIFLDGQPVITGDVTGITTGNIDEDDNIINEIPNEVDGPFGITDNTLYFLNIEGKPIAKWYNNTLTATVIIDNHHVDIPLAEHLVYKTQSAYLLFRDNRQWWLQFGIDRLVVHEAIHSEPIEPLPEYVESGFSISQLGNYITWKYDGNNILTVDLEERIIQSDYVLDNDVYTVSIAIAPKPIQHSPVTGQDIILLVNPYMWKYAGGSPLKSYTILAKIMYSDKKLNLPVKNSVFQAGVNIPSTGDTSFLTVDDNGMLLFNGLYMGEVVTYLTFNIINNIRYLQTPFALQFGEEE